MKIYGKFVALVGLIIGTTLWLAMGGMGQSKTYYTTIAELNAMGERALERRLRVAGDVEPGSIVRKEREVKFVLSHDNLRLKVVYLGLDPLPDTFRDRAQALADGKMGQDGVFHASKLQAKCASKYEAKPAAKHKSSEVVAYSDKRR